MVSILIWANLRSYEGSAGDGDIISRESAE